jgi:hypothetical protein
MDVAQPTKPGVKVYPARCKQCLGTGRIQIIANWGGLTQPNAILHSKATPTRSAFLQTTRQASGVSSPLKRTLKRSGISWGLLTSIAAPEMLMSEIRQLTVTSAHLITPDISTPLREAERLSIKMHFAAKALEI